jgi:hypothetical protein
MKNLVLLPFAFIYKLTQQLLNFIFSPTPPKPGTNLGRPKIAIIGAGLTGISAASHCVGHGFDVHIFEAGPRKNLGGIWSVSKHHLLLFLNSISTKSSRFMLPTEGEQYLRLTDPFHHVPFPPLGTLVRWLPQPPTNRFTDH